MNLLLKLIYQSKLYLFCVRHRKQINSGKHLSVRRGFFVKLGKKASITIGNNCFFNNDCSLNVMEQIVVGDDCLFGENVKLYDHDHLHEQGVLFREQGFVSAPIIIGNNCWIGANVTILKGVKIGDNVVVAAGTVVTQDVPENTIIYQKRNTVYKINSRH
ncbi:acyltransferase [Lactiplantibacillus plantarum]|uniref:acyltransferase n=1 Tax=Lactiplantibacillus plantarum TaxID=1590 RepID=UPI000787C1AA|nr:acyltransferase [Lactiplantibacillus plantarum]MCS6093854.1 acyltransferase [Lactobacillus sp. LMY-20]ASX21141.1 hypothetical protein BGV74_04840 [Lactiplantibacillus plantarum]KYK51880.1 hypothetical protein AYO51_06250 [Lactiplantibacillus plantarum]KYM69364.1 hypothetical protein AZJ01_12065 [Lactiplantibacillus plantarum]MBE1726922.1 acyltransferase [Lactiplantibacillus plantarum]